MVTMMVMRMIMTDDGCGSGAGNRGGGDDVDWRQTRVVIESDYDGNGYSSDADDGGWCSNEDDCGNDKGCHIFGNLLYARSITFYLSNWI